MTITYLLTSFYKWIILFCDSELLTVSCVLYTAGSLVFGSVLKQDEKLYKCDAYNYVVRQTTGGSYYRIIVQQGIPLTTRQCGLVIRSVASVCLCVR